MITSSGFVSSNDNGDSYPNASVQLISISPLFQINRAVKMCDDSHVLDGGELDGKSFNESFRECDIIYVLCR